MTVLHMHSDLNLKSWMVIKKKSNSSPNDILDILLCSQEYQVAREWAVVHQVDNDFMQVCS